MRTYYCPAFDADGARELALRLVTGVITVRPEYKNRKLAVERASEDNNTLRVPLRVYVMSVTPYADGTETKYKISAQAVLPAPDKLCIVL